MPPSIERPAAKREVTFPSGVSFTTTASIHPLKTLTR